MSQISQPDLDVYTGGWQTPPVYSKINDTHPHDETFVSSGGKPEGDAFKVHFKGLMAPQAGDQILTVRMQKVGTGSEHVWMSLVESKEGKPTVVIAARRVDPTDVYADYSLTLTSDEAKRISDYACLYLRVSAVQDDSSSSSSGSGSTSGGSSSGGSTSRNSTSNGSGSSSIFSSSGSGSQSASNSFSSHAGSTSSGNSSSTGITVPCCPNPLSATLYATFGGSLSSLGTKAMSYDLGTIGWVGEWPGCGGTVRVVLTCSGPSPEWSTAVTVNGFPLSATPTEESCSPLLLTVPVTVTGGICDGGGIIDITETPP